MRWWSCGRSTTLRLRAPRGHRRGARAPPLPPSHQPCVSNPPDAFSAQRLRGKATGRQAERGARGGEARRRQVRATHRACGARSAVLSTGAACSGGPDRPSPKAARNGAAPAVRTCKLMAKVRSRLLHLFLRVAERVLFSPLLLPSRTSRRRSRSRRSARTSRGTNFRTSFFFALMENLVSH